MLSIGLDLGQCAHYAVESLDPVVALKHVDFVAVFPGTGLDSSCTLLVSGSSWNLSSVLLSSAGLLYTCSWYVVFRSQPEMWTELHTGMELPITHTLLSGIPLSPSRGRSDSDVCCLFRPEQLQVFCWNFCRGTNHPGLPRNAGFPGPWVFLCWNWDIPARTVLVGYSEFRLLRRLQTAVEDMKNPSPSAILFLQNLPVYGTSQDL